YDSKTRYEGGDLMLLVSQRAEIGVADAEIHRQRCTDLPVIVHEPVDRVLRVVALQEASRNGNAGRGPYDGRAARVSRVTGEKVEQGFLLGGVGRQPGPGPACSIEGNGPARVCLVEDIVERMAVLAADFELVAAASPTDGIGEVAGVVDAAKGLG